VAVGPAAEAREALMALEGKEVPTSLIEKSTALAGMVLEQGGVREGKGKEEAKRILESGEALAKMKEIIEAQRGDLEVTSEDIRLGEFTKDVLACDEGYVGSIHNSDIIKIVRSAGAPHDNGAGLILNKKKGDKVEVDEVLFTIFSEHEKKLDEAYKLAKHLDPFDIEGMILESHPEFKTV